MNQVKLKRLEPGARWPTKATEGSAYYDLYAVQDGMLEPEDVWVVDTGWYIEVPVGYFLDIRSRSGMSILGMVVANAPGTIDEDYRGSLKVILINLSRQNYFVHRGDKVAQCALMPVVPTSFEEVEELSVTDRGKKGYGSSGR